MRENPRLQEIISSMLRREWSALLFFYAVVSVVLLGVFVGWLGATALLTIYVMAYSVLGDRRRMILDAIISRSTGHTFTD